MISRCEKRKPSSVHGTFSIRIQQWYSFLSIGLEQLHIRPSNRKSYNPIKILSQRSPETRKSMPMHRCLSKKCTSGGADALGLPPLPCPFPGRLEHFVMARFLRLQKIVQSVDSPWTDYSSCAIGDLVPLLPFFFLLYIELVIARPTQVVEILFFPSLY